MTLCGTGYYYRYIKVLFFKDVFTKFHCRFLLCWSTIDGLHCRHVGVQNKRKFVGIVSIKIEVNSQRRKILMFLYTNMATMTSHANHQLKLCSFWLINTVCLLTEEVFHRSVECISFKPITSYVNDSSYHIFIYPRILE